MSCTPGPNWGGLGPSDSSSSYDYEAERQRHETERLRRLEEERHPQRELKEQHRREEEEARQRQEEFERNKHEALRDMKGNGAELGLKNADSGGLVLKDIGDNRAGNLGLKETTRPDGEATNPQIAKIMRNLRAIEVPPPLSAQQVSLSWNGLSPNGHSSETMLTVADIGVLAWDLAGRMGERALLPHAKVLLIAGKIFIAGEEGAYVHVIQQDRVYEQALQYLKNPATSKRFAEVVRRLAEGRRIPATVDPAMLRAARALVDPALGSSAMRIAWDAMLSPEARAAMARKACLEIGSELVSTGTEGLVSELTNRRRLYETARLERERARKMLGQSTDPLDKAQLRKVITHANVVLESIYRLEQVGPKAAGELAAIYVEGETPGHKSAP